METLTTEEVKRHITAAFDSVNLINELVIAGVNTEAVSARIKANVGHLNIMLEKEWFAEGLTVEERQDIDTCIVSGNEFVGNQINTGYGN